MVDSGLVSVRNGVIQEGPRIGEMVDGVGIDCGYIRHGEWNSNNTELDSGYSENDEIPIVPIDNDNLNPSRAGSVVAP